MRINITLPESTLALIDTATKKGNRSKFLDDAARFYVKQKGRAEINRLIKRGAIQNAERDLAIAAEWFPADQETWDTSLQA